MKEYQNIISIRQPWAWLILHGGKDIENRNWKTRFRGKIYIHASRTIDQKAVDHFQEEFDFPDQFQTGGIVGEAHLVDCVTQHPSDWFEGKYGFVLENPKPLPFMPCLGQLNFFTRQI